MKAVILAAGKGTRMLPLTEKTPKVLIGINGNPFLNYVIENLKEAGFTEFGIVVGHLKEKIAEFVEINGINAKLIEQTEQKGTGHALLQAHDFCGEDDFVMLAGDHLWSVKDFQSIGKNDEFNYVSVFKVDDPSRYGVIAQDGEMLKEIVEKPKEFIGNLINVSLYKFTPEIFSALEKVGVSSRGEIEVTDAVNDLAREGKVKINVLHDYWLDLQGVEDIEKIEKFLAAKPI